MFFGASGGGLHIPSTEELFSWPDFAFKGTVFGINKTVLLYFLGALIVGFLWIVGSRRQSLVPRGLQNLMEVFYGFIRNNIVIEVMGVAGLSYVPFLATLFSFIFVLNLFEITPFILFPPTSRIALPAFFAILVWVIFIVQGIRSQGAGHYFKGILFPPGVPKPIYILLTPIELISVFIVRPLTLAVRLFANMVAGHTLVTMFLIFCETTLFADSIGVKFVVIPSFIGAVGMLGFEIFVSAIQAFIFTILAAVYIGESIHGH